MDAKTKSRLIKLLALTMSESDGEALSAIRMANAILRKHNLSWAQIIPENAPEPSGPRVQPMDAQAQAVWEAMKAQARAYAQERQRRGQP